MLRSVNGVRINVLDEGSGTPIVFLHGLGGCWHDWEPQLDTLSDRFRCVVVEHRGHGRSERTSGRYSTELFAADTAALCRQLGIDHTHVVGMSMGGMVAQKLALAEPELVDALVLCDTGAFLGEGVAEILRQMAADARDKGFPDSRGVVAPDSLAFSAYTIEHQPHVARANQREAESMDPDAWARAAIAVAEHDTRAELERITAPTLLVWGEHDASVPLEFAEALRDGLGGAPLVTLPDAGHMCNLEQPEAFNATVVDFLAKHPGERT